MSQDRPVVGDDRPETYWVEDRDQIAALASARRHDIIDRLVASGPLSIKELAAQIGAQPSALYHHIKQLLDVGLVVETGTRTVRRKRERIYGVPGKRMRLARALSSSQHQPLMEDIVASLTRQMDRDFRLGGRSRKKLAEGDARNYGFGRLVGRPSAADLARINACLSEISELLWKSSDPDAELISFNWVVTPLPSARRG